MRSARHTPAKRDAPRPSRLAASLFYHILDALELVCELRYVQLHARAHGGCEGYAL